MISGKAGNWVDRGEPPDKVVRQLLYFYLDLDPDTDTALLAEYVQAVQGMVEADATDFNVAGYLVMLERAHGIVDRQTRHRRAVASAMWHAVKAAEVRDRALRLLRAYPELTTTRQPLAEWLIERLGRLPEGPPPDGEAR